MVFVRSFFVSCVAVLCSTSLGQGHEFWIDVEDWQIAPGEQIVGDLVNGQNFEGVRQAYLPTQFRRFDITMGDLVTPVPGRTGDRPALSAQILGEGLASVQHVTTDRATVAMITRTAQELSIAVTEADGTPVAVAVEPSIGRRHAFTFDGLRAAVQYRYELRRADGGVADAGSFRTAPEDDRDKVRFAVVGDSGGLPWWIWLQTSPLWYVPADRQWLPTRGSVTAIGARIAKADPDFVLHVGDIVYPPMYITRPIWNGLCHNTVSIVSVFFLCRKKNFIRKATACIIHKFCDMSCRFRCILKCFQHCFKRG